MAEVFLSYAHKDSAIVSRLQELLEEKGIEVWHDIHQLRPLGHFTEEIASAIRDCNVFLMIFSNAYYNSVYCGKEYAYAVDDCGKSSACIIIEENCPWVNTRFGFDFAGQTIPGYGQGISSQNDIHDLVNQVCASEAFVSLQAIRNNSSSEKTAIRFDERPLMRLKQSFDISNRAKEYWINKEYDEDLAPLFIFENEYNSEEESSDNRTKKTDNNIVKLKFGELINKEISNRIVVFGNGGMGKTTAMLEYGRALLDEAKPVVYIHLSEVQFSEVNSGQYNHIEKYVHDRICVDEGTWRYIRTVGSNKVESAYRLTILLDGINELPGISAQIAVKEIVSIADYWQSTDIVVCTRSLPERYRDQMRNFDFFSVLPLSTRQVLKYLNKKEICSNEILPEKTMQLLRNPLRLMIYTQTYPYYEVYSTQIGMEKMVHKEPDSAGKLLDNYLVSQLHYFISNCGMDENKKPEITGFILCELLCPYIGWILYTRGRNDLQEKEVKGILKDFQSHLECEWRDYYQTRIEELLWDYNYSSEYSWNFFDAAIVLRMLNILTLRSGVGGSKEYSFPHQMFRDYFAARFVALHIEGNLRNNGCFIDEGKYVLLNEKLNEEVIQYASDIMEEEKSKPYLDVSTGWVFPGKREGQYAASTLSPVEQTLEYFRDRNSVEARLAINNLMQILNYARSGFLANVDFSNLDLRLCNLRNAYYSLWYKDQVFGSSFDGSYIDENCIMCNTHQANVTAIHYGMNRILFSGDADGIVISVDTISNTVVNKWVLPDKRIVCITQSRISNVIVIATPHSIFQIIDDNKIQRVMHDESIRIKLVRVNELDEVEYCTDIEPICWYDVSGICKNGETKPKWLSGAYVVFNNGKNYCRSGLFKYIYFGTLNDEGVWHEHGNWLYDYYPIHKKNCMRIAKPLQRWDRHFPINEKEKNLAKTELYSDRWIDLTQDKEIEDFRKKMLQYFNSNNSNNEKRKRERIRELKHIITKLLMDVEQDYSKRISCIKVNASNNRILIANGNTCLEFSLPDMELLNYIKFSDTITCLEYINEYSSEMYVAIGHGANISIVDKDFAVSTSINGEQRPKKIIEGRLYDGRKYILCTDGLLRLLDESFRINKIRSLPNRREFCKIYEEKQSGKIKVAYPLTINRWTGGELYDFETNAIEPLRTGYNVRVDDDDSLSRGRRISNSRCYLLRKRLLVVSRDETMNESILEVPYTNGLFIQGCTFRNLRGNIAEHQLQTLYMNGGIIV